MNGWFQAVWFRQKPWELVKKSGEDFGVFFPLQKNAKRKKERKKASFFLFGWVPNSKQISLDWDIWADLMLKKNTPHLWVKSFTIFPFLGSIHTNEIERSWLEKIYATRCNKKCSVSIKFVSQKSSGKKIKRKYKMGPKTIVINGELSPL